MNKFVNESEENLSMQLQDKKRAGVVHSYAQGIHPNPNFYKYHWQIYISPPVNWQQIEGEENFDKFKRNYGVEHSNGKIENEYTGTYKEYLILQAINTPNHQNSLKEKVYAMPNICHADFLKKIKWLKINKIDCVISNNRTPRRDAPVKWDHNSNRYKDIEFALSLNDDNDELAPDGHK